ncbi:MAG TPA: indolepyruvate oxidoreductase subunit beta [Candidatus Cloacimonadota bacterium]|nr:indolepyruvate oxidoreductase subunit beta [Candidatus Cloacimonadota bacterium]
MKKDIILAGVGGQGILTIATVIGNAALDAGLNLKQAEVHGMSQRGGDVQSHMRISDKPIYSDLIPFGGADIILSVEPMESLRYLPYLAKDGWLITNTTPFNNIAKYPEMDDVLNAIAKVPHQIMLNADEIAKNLNAARSMNIVMLGAASFYLDISAEKLEEGIKSVFEEKGEKIVESNIAAFRAGREYAAKAVSN